MRQARRALLIATLAVGAAAFTHYPDYPFTQWLWLPDLLVGVAALGLAVASWRSSWISSMAPMVLAAAWWAGTLWSPALYWHRGLFVYVALVLPRVWPRTRVAAGVVLAAGVITVISPLWQSDAVALTIAVALVLAGGVEWSGRTARVVPPVLLAAAFCSSSLLRHTSDQERLGLVVYDALLLATLAMTGWAIRAPSRAALTDLAVGVRPAPVADAAALMGLVHSEPGLISDGEIGAALESAQRLHAGNERAREQVTAALLEVSAARRRLVVAEAAERARLAAELTATAASPLAELIDRAEGLGIAVAPLQRAAISLEAAVSGLRPPRLQLGLPAALGHMPLIRALDVELDLDDARCDEAVEDALYSVAAEALTNVAKHAGPCRTALTYRANEDMARLTISDDGRGGIEPAAGGGLSGLFDRLEALGGTLSVDSTEGAGTAVTASVPREVPEGAPHHPSAEGTPAAARTPAPA